MSTDLDSLKDEIRAYLEAEGFPVFHSGTRLAEPHLVMHWDVQRYPDFRKFLEAPKQLGAKPIVFHYRELESEFVDDALSDLDSADMPRDVGRRLTERLRELRVWEGFTSVVELSYAYEGFIYVYARRAEWYEEILEIAEEIDDFLSGEEEDDPSDDMGGYFSRN